MQSRRDSINRLRYRGSTYLEVQVALILFVLGVTGLAPLAVVNSRQAKALRERVPADTAQYLAPPANPWAAKLGRAAGASESAPPPNVVSPTLINNADSGFSLEFPALWTYEYSANAYKQWYRRNILLLLSGHAFWTFHDLEPAHYEIYVTYPASILHGSATPYTVFDGNDQLGTVDVNQTVAPSGPAYDGVNWKSLGQYAITSGTLRVRMGSFTTILVAADAVRIVRLANEVDVLSVQESPAQDQITVEARVTP